MRNEEAKLILEQYIPKDSRGNFKSMQTLKLTEAMLLAIRALEERPEGKWIMHIDNLFPEDSSQECSNCHEYQQLLGDDNYCPCCGAKMIGTEMDYVLVKERRINDKRKI